MSSTVKEVNSFEQHSIEEGAAMSQELQELLIFRIPMAPIDVPSLFGTDKIYSVDCKQDFNPHECLRVGIRSQWDCPDRPVASFLAHYRYSTSLLYEAPLKQFHRWFSPLPFMKVFDSKACQQEVVGNQDGPATRTLTWDYRMVFLKPQQEIDPDDPKVQDLKWAQDKLHGFYRRSFDLPPGHLDLEQIQNSIDRDQSIMIVAFRFDTSTPPTSIIRLKKFAILAAVTFRLGNAKVTSEATCARVLWIAVSNTTNRARPDNIQEWRHLRFGSFMLLSVIKLCVLSGGTNDTVALYAQCRDDATRLFFKACGFRTMSEGLDGFPPSFQDSVDTASIKDVDNGAAHDSPAHDSQDCFVLRPGYFVIPSKRDVILIDDDGPDSPVKKGAPEKEDEDLFIWCRYPPLSNSQMVSISANDLASCFTNVPLIANLISLPLNTLVAPTTLCYKGEMTTERRIKHRHDTYMSTGEMEMMLALLFSDGRYENEVAVFPSIYMSTIGEAATAHQQWYECHDRAATFVKNRHSMFRDESIARLMQGNTHISQDAAYIQFDEETVRMSRDLENSPIEIEKGVRQNPGDIKREYNRLVLLVIQKIIEPNPKMFEKALLVFPKCKGSHWSGVFVFNANSIAEHGTNESKNAMQPCFFRYCSLKPNGERNVASLEVIWFLNFLYSYNQHRQQTTSICTDDANQQKGAVTMLWANRFESSSVTHLKGTNTFPSMRLREGQSLPHQNDDYNCGFGLIAAIGIFMNYVISSECKHSLMKTQVERVWCEQTKEICIHFPSGMLEQPKLDRKLLNAPDYLVLLRKEWFRLFDCLAEFYLGGLTGQQIVSKDDVPDSPFHRVKSKLLFPADASVVSAVQQETTSEKKGMAAAESLMQMSKVSEVTQSQEPGAMDGSQEGSSKTEQEDSGKLEKFQKPGAMEDSGMLEDRVDTPAVKPEEIRRSPGRPKKDQARSKATTAMLPKRLTRSSASRTAKNKKPPARKTSSQPSQRARPKETKGPAKKRRKKDTPYVSGELDWKEGHPDPPLWLDIPKTLEPNTWKPNWKRGAKGDPSLLFGDEKVKEMTTNQSQLAGRDVALSQHSLDEFHMHWRQYNDMGSVRLNESAMDDYVDKRFVEWEWSSDEQHRAELDYFRALRDAWQASSKPEREKALVAFYYKDLLTAMKKERRYFRKQFEKEYQLSNPLMVTGLRYHKKNHKFTARITNLQYRHVNEEKTRKGWQKVNQQFDVSEEWVLHDAGFDNAVLDHILNMNVDDGYFVVPQDRILHDPETVTGIKFDAKTNTFMARVQSTQNVKQLVDDMEIMESAATLSTQTQVVKVVAKLLISTIKVTEDWVQQKAGMLPGEVKAATDVDTDGFVSIALDKGLKVYERRVVRIKYVPKQVRHILDVQKLRDVVSGVKCASKGKRPKKKQISVDEHWIVKYSDGHTLSLLKNDSFVTQNFSEKFLEELRRTRKAFVDIPVGDHKPSFLFCHPELILTGAPKIQYIQGYNEDLCVSNSLAATFHNLGLIKAASKIAEFGRMELSGGAVDALDKVAAKARDVLPRWIEIHKKNARTITGQN